ncbi:MAG: sugar ABC transporter permease, partial [Candidatus Rokuibacteriota bacterium]
MIADTFLIVTLLAAATVRGAAPLVLAALGGLFAERSGVVDIGLEGKMLTAAFAAAATAAVTGSVWIGLVAGIAASVLFALLHGFACVTHQGNQVVSGMALNITVSGLTVVLGYAWFQEGGQTPLLAPGARFGPIELPGAAALAPLPVIGPIYREVISGHNLLVYVAAAAVPIVAWLVYRTRFGLRLRAVGESPGAVDTAGVSVSATRYMALVGSGILCGLSGAYLSTAHHASFIRDMSAGKGYLALAALIFGQWRPLPTLGACLLFAFADAVQLRLQGTPLPFVGVVPVQLIQAIPYILTVALLA